MRQALTQRLGAGARRQAPERERVRFPRPPPTHRVLPPRRPPRCQTAQQATTRSRWKCPARQQGPPHQALLPGGREGTLPRGDGLAEQQGDGATVRCRCCQRYGWSRRRVRRSRAVRHGRHSGGAAPRRGHHPQRGDTGMTLRRVPDRSGRTGDPMQGNRAGRSRSCARSVHRALFGSPRIREPSPRHRHRVSRVRSEPRSHVRTHRP